MHDEADDRGSSRRESLFFKRGIPSKKSSSFTDRILIVG
jgi:hypothetical protein